MDKLKIVLILAVGLTLIGSGLAEEAVYDSNLGAPYCYSGESPCNARSSLIKSRSSITGMNEPNQPNTIDACTDGTTGSYEGFFGEAVQNITIESLNNSLEIKPGDTINVTATVYCGRPFFGSFDNINFVYTNSTSSPSWKVFGYESKCNPRGYHTFSDTTVIDRVEGNHSIRVLIEKGGSTSSTCGVTDYADNDDLIFKVSLGEPPNVHSPSITEDGVEKSFYWENSTVRIKVNVTDEEGLSSLRTANLTIRDAAGSLVDEGMTMKETSIITNGRTYEYNYTIPLGRKKGVWTATILSTDNTSKNHQNSVKFRVNSIVVDTTLEWNEGAFSNTLSNGKQGEVQLSSLVTSKKVNATEWCSTTGNTAFNAYLERVIFNGIDRNSGDDEGYLDATDSVSKPLIRNSSYPIKVQTGPLSLFQMSLSVAIDWDNSSTFEPYEVSQIGTGGSSEWINGTINVPENATLGTSTIMRVSGSLWGYPDPCKSSGVGEVEDYSVSVERFVSKGSYLSRKFDVGKRVVWLNSSVNYVSDPQTNFEIQYGENSSGRWIWNQEIKKVLNSRHLGFSMALNTTDGANTPKVQNVTLVFEEEPNYAPKISEIDENSSPHLPGMTQQIDVVAVDGNGGDTIDSVKLIIWHRKGSEELQSDSWDHYTVSAPKSIEKVNVTANKYRFNPLISKHALNGSYVIKAYAQDYKKAKGSGVTNFSIVARQGLTLNTSSLTALGEAGDSNILFNENPQHLENDGNVNQSIYINGTDLVGPGKILAGNITYSHNNTLDLHMLKNSEEKIKEISPLSRGVYPNASRENIYYWLDCPLGIKKGEYKGKISVKGMNFNRVTADVRVLIKNSPPEVNLLSPEDGSSKQPLETDLAVEVEDRNRDLLNVTFYEGSTAICRNKSVESGSIVKCRWSGLKEEESYRWYVEITDGTNTTRSKEWNFTTKKGKISEENVEEDEEDSIIAEEEESSSQETQENLEEDITLGALEENSAPEIMINSPSQGEVNVSVPVTLNVTVIDKDRDMVNVTFYDEENNVLCKEEGVVNGTVVTCVLEELEPGKEFRWVVKATDGKEETTRGPRIFTTRIYVSLVDEVVRSEYFRYLSVGAVVAAVMGTGLYLLFVNGNKKGNIKL